MKKLIMLLMAIALVVACKDNPVSKKIKETKQNVKNTNKAVKEINNMKDDLEELKEMEPLTNDDFKAWLPEEIDGMKRTRYKAGQAAFIQIATVEATYESEDKSRRFHVQIIDGAGEMGANATAGIRLLLSQDYEEETDRRIKKTVKHKGNKALEESEKDGSRTVIQYLHDNRFHVHATGTNMDSGDTWDAIDEMDLDDLG